MMKIDVSPDNWQALLPHEYANIFPLVPTDDLKTTFPTMWETGYDDAWPIVLFEGKILDGRNRLRAAIQAKREPTFMQFAGTREEALRWALTANLDRRHLTDPQRAMVAARIEPMFAAVAKERMVDAGREGGTKAGRGRPVTDRGVVLTPHPYDDPASKPAPKARDEAAAALNVSPVTVQRAKKLIAERPDLAAEVDAGKKGVWEASYEAFPVAGRGKKAVALAATSEPLTPEEKARLAELEARLEKNLPILLAAKKERTTRPDMDGMPTEPYRPYPWVCHTHDPIEDDKRTFFSPDSHVLIRRNDRFLDIAFRLSNFYIKSDYGDFLRQLMMQAHTDDIRFLIEECHKELARRKEEAPQ